MSEEHRLGPLRLPDPLRSAIAEVRGHAARLRTHVRSALTRTDCPSEGYSLSISETRPTNVLRCTRRGLGFAAVIPGESVAEGVIFTGISSTLSLYQTAIFVRLILTWFPNPPAAIANPLSTVCDPYLNLFRGVIPPLGGIDLSPILAIVVLDLLSGSTAGLSAELPPSASDAASYTAPSCG